MGNLFVAFDQNSSIFGAPLNWVTGACSMMILAPSYWVCSSQASMTQTALLRYVTGEFKAIMGGFCAPGSLWVSVSLFSYILVLNFSGLLPYIFPLSSHLPLAFSLALPLWVGHMAFSWFRQSGAMFAHLVPLGTPGALIPFMVCIELVSSTIRPLTLSVRLVANIIAGHLLLTLLGSLGPNVNAALVFVFVSLMVLALLETGVAAIQAYVFSALSTLYLSEVSSKNLL